MSAAKQPDSYDGEFELDLTAEIDAKKTEQREDPREQASASLIGKVEFRNEQTPVRIDDLSVGGAGLRMESRLPLNAECMLTIQLSVCGSDYELTMKCRVRHCDAINNKTYYAGVQFIDMPQSTRDTLVLLIR